MAKKAENAQRKYVSVQTTSLSPFRADLSSSLARSAGEWWPFRKGVYSTHSTQGWGLWVQKFSPILFFVHSFGYRYARYPFKGCKDADFCLVSDKILIQHNGSMGWGLGPGKSGKKNAKTPPLVAFPPESVKPETKKFFRSQLEGLLNP